MIIFEPRNYTSTEKTEFIMTEIEKIEKEIRDVNEKYLRNVIDLISDYNNENKTKDDYKGRQIYELLQNADDCYTEIEERIKVKFELKDNKLIIQNTGKPFDARGITSLMHPDASSKYKDTIGCKGLGFRSVLNWAYDITICTNDFCVNFSKERATEKCKFYKNNADRTHIEEINNIERIAILSSASILNQEETKKYLENGYSTSIVLCCEQEYIKIIQQQLIDLQFEELLFLKHIREIEIKSLYANRNIEAINVNETILIQEEDRVTEWKIWEKHDEIQQSNGYPKKYELIIAYNTDCTIRENIRKNGVLYSFFKTEIPMPFPFLIHGTFDLTSERNGLIKDNENNRILIDILIDFILEKGTLIAGVSATSNYEALKFLIPASDLYFLDKEYNFTEKIKNRAKKYKIFPSINGKYISIDDAPKYSDRDFAGILNPDTFSNVLKICDDERIKKFLTNECKIGFYNDIDFVNLVNKDAEEYVSDKKYIRLIELYCDAYNESKIAPNILIDNDNIRIDDNSIKVFINPSNSFSLPEWGKLRFINKDLENKLRSSFNNCTIRQLLEKLEKFGCDEYSFDRIVRELTNQCKDDKQKVKSLLFWLFTTWKNNDQKFYSSLTNIDIKIITKNNEIIGCSKCYFGNEYNNAVGERIINCTHEPFFIANVNDLGFENESPELLKVFLKQLGVREYPHIELCELRAEQFDEYINYNSKYYSTLYTDKNEALTHTMLFSQYDKSIKVDSIREIDSILSNASFNDIIYWILNDNELYAHITNGNEISDDAVMKGYPPKKQDARYVKKDQMKSWLHKKFLEYKWLPTVSGKKVNAYDLTIAQHKLSPIVEVLAIDYEKLNNLFNRNSKKDIEALLEKIEVADDIVNLSKEKIYDILLNLPNLDKDCSLGKKIYTQLNLFYKDDKLNKLITDNKKYEEFKKNGKVLAEKNGELKYLPVSDVYYVGKKIYSDDILDDFPKLALNRRVGDPKVEKMFCVQSIRKIGNIEVCDMCMHSLNDAYQKEYLRILPYIYAKRIDYDNKNKELNILKKSKICLVTNAKTIYHIGDKEKCGKLKDYEVIYANNEKIAYIKIPDFIKTIEELKKEMSFISSISEVITTMIDVDGDKDAFTIILRCQNIKEIEDYFKGNGDDTLSIVNLAKEKFSASIDSKEEFWAALSQTTSINLELLRKESMIDYENINSLENASLIIELFSKLNIDVSDYNKYAYEPIDLIPFFHHELMRLKNEYRNKYLLFVVKNIIDTHGTKTSFENKRNEYDFNEIQVSNHIGINVVDLFEEKIGIKLNVLDKLEGNYLDLLSSLRNEHDDLTESIPNTNTATPDKQTTLIDFEELNKTIAGETSDDSIKVEIIANPTIKRDSYQTKHKPKTHGEATQQSKDYDGFVAESKVYNVLTNRIKDNGSVEWVSGNAQKAGKISQGDDSLGYDLKYSDSNGTHYVEVKGSSSNLIEFNLTKNEFEFADKNKDFYELWFVFIGDDKKPETPIELGNIMKFENGESFFSNSRFSVEQSEFKIRAKIKECE